MSIAPRDQVFLRLADRYEIIGTLGEGGMATVHRARIKSVADATKEVAVKLMRPELAADGDFVMMFLDEMRMAMALTHRNIVQTFDAGEAEGRHYLAMELVEGCSLHQLMSRQGGRPLPLDIALFIASEVAAALAYAHGFKPPVAGLPEGVIHRDLSPGNILLSVHGDVKLADFGVAKAAGRLGHSDVGAIKGKLRYIAPEQVRGEACPQSDIFSLGAVLYEMTHDEPFRSSPSWTQVGRGGEAPARFDLSGSFEAPSPANLASLLASCVADDPEDRPASAQEVAEALSDALFAVQREQGRQTDPRLRLSAFLGQQGLSTPAADAATDEAEAVARLLVQQAKEVPTLAPEREAEPSTAKLGPDTGDVTTVVEDKTLFSPAAAGGPSTSSMRMVRWTATLIALALLLTAAVLIAISVAHVDDPPPTAGLRGVAGDGDQGVPRRAPSSPPPDTKDGGHQTARSAGDTGVVRRHATPARASRRPGQSRRLPRRPRPATGLLDINALPWAKVYVDGRFRGNTPRQDIRLTKGVHQVRLVNREQGLEKRLTVTIVAGKRVRRVVNMRGQ